jgi:hypothetical protein
MKKQIVLFVLILSSCSNPNDNNCKNTFKEVLSIGGFINFDSTGIKYYPNYKSFNQLRLIEKNDKIDFLQRHSFDFFLKHKFHDFEEPFSDFILVENYFSGESIVNSKIIIVKFKQSINVFLFKSVLGEWVLNNTSEVDDKKWNKIGEIRSSEEEETPNTSNGISIISKFECGKKMESSVISRNQYIDIFQTFNQ